MKRQLFCLATILLLAACTQPEVPTAAPKAPVVAAPAAPVDSRPVIVAFGDSLSAGYGANSGESYPDYLQQLLDRRGYRYRVVNQGISGDTTMGGRFRTAAALELKPEIVILELGGNDGLRGLPIKQTRENMETMVAEFTKAGAKVLIAGITLPPNYGADYIRDFERIFADTATKYRVPRIPFLLETVIAAPGAMQADGIHPTAKGNEQVAAYVLRYLEPMLRR
jgi:acyl-CoA thioesterase-1